MNRKLDPSRRFVMSQLAIFGFGFLALAGPARAAADGSPHLDPTNNINGTSYTLTMRGASSSMDPALSGALFAWKGTLLFFQDAGAANFDADMALDINGDGIPDRSLSCTGMVGNGRFSLRCSANDGNGELRFLVTGRAVTLDTRKIGLRRAAGRGYTDTNTFGATFQATEQ